MRKFLLSILACTPVLVSCVKQKKTASLQEIFVESLKQQKIELLEPYFPTIEFHKSLERNNSGQSDSAALKFVEESNIKLKENWAKISERVKNNNIDLSRLKITESLTAHPFWNKKISRLVVIYNYGNRNWDDLEFVLGEFNDKNLLLEIPHPENVFSMKDSALNTSSNIRFEIEIRTPEFKKTLQDLVEKIIASAKENKVKEFREYIVYPENDETGNPETDPASKDERRNQIADELMQRINNILKDCDKPVYGDVNSLDLQDDRWIVIQLKCSNKFVHFAFNRINDKLLLNDVNDAGIK